MRQHANMDQLRCPVTDLRQQPVKCFSMLISLMFHSHPKLVYIDSEFHYPDVLLTQPRAFVNSQKTVSSRVCANRSDHPQDPTHTRLVVIIRTWDLTIL